MTGAGPDDPLPTRRAGLADAGAVRALTRAAYAHWVAPMGCEPRPMTADYDRAVEEHRIDLVEEGGAPLALVETVVRPDDLLIVNVAVAPAHRGKGLGRALLRHAERLARDAGRATVRLYTNEKMTGNVALYERHGFAIERVEVIEVGTVVHMAKDLGR